MQPCVSPRVHCLRVDVWLWRTQLNHSRATSFGIIKQCASLLRQRNIPITDMCCADKPPQRAGLKRLIAQLIGRGCGSLAQACSMAQHSFVAVCKYRLAVWYPKLNARIAAPRLARHHGQLRVAQPIPRLPGPTGRGVPTADGVPTSDGGRGQRPLHLWRPVPSLVPPPGPPAALRQGGARVAVHSPQRSAADAPPLPV